MDNSKIFKNSGVEPSSIRGAVCEVLMEKIAEQFLVDYDLVGFVDVNALIPLFPNTQSNSKKNSKTQLDIVIITDRCIMVVECKSLFKVSKVDKRGVITTSFGKTLKPWQQNRTHIQSLKENIGTLGIDEEILVPLKNIVYVFSIGQILGKKPNATDEEILLITKGCLQILKEIYDKSDCNKPLSNKNMLKIAKFLKECKPTNEQMVAHIEELKVRHGG